MNLPRRSVLWVVAAVAATPFALLVWNAMTPGDDPALVFAPSSLAPLQDTIDATLAAEGIDAVEWVFAGSQSLVAQIADGAPADVLITADQVSFDAAIAAGFDGTATGGRVTIATNHLVLAVAPGDPGEIAALADLGDPDRLIGLCAVDVPCGRLATEALDSVGVVPSVDTHETSVRALTTKIASGELDAGLIYRSDAIAAGLAVVDEDALAHVITIYQSSWTGDPAHLGFASFLTSSAFEGILLDAGFGT